MASCLSPPAGSSPAGSRVLGSWSTEVRGTPSSSAWTRSTRPSSPSSPSQRRRWRMRDKRPVVVLTVCVGVFMVSLDLFIVNIAFPAIQKSFHGTSVSGLSWILNAYAISFGALLVPAGRWADRVGRKRVFLLGLGVFTAASAACAAAPSVLALVIARALQAVGAAMVFPTSLGLLLPEWP